MSCIASYFMSHASLVIHVFQSVVEYFYSCDNQNSCGTPNFYFGFIIDL